jgi:hypothetical protein
MVMPMDRRACAIRSGRRVRMIVMRVRMHMRAGPVAVIVHIAAPVRLPLDRFALLDHDLRLAASANATHPGSFSGPQAVTSAIGAVVVGGRRSYKRAFAISTALDPISPLGRCGLARLDDPFAASAAAVAFVARHRRRRRRRSRLRAAPTATMTLSPEAA